MKNPILKVKNLIITFCTLHFAFLISCSQPVLESPECIASREAVKRFYSYHTGNDMNPSAENLEMRKEFLSRDLQEMLSKQKFEKKDYFTQTDNYPQAFRVGKCINTGENKTEFEVLLFWRTDERNIQRQIKVETANENDKWLINKITPVN